MMRDAATSTGIDAEVCVRVEEFVLNVELSAHRGELLALTGPNGSGKTTLLHALAGLLPLERGRIVLGDRVVDDPAAGIWVHPERRDVGCAFQDVRLFPHLSALENVEFGLLHRARVRTAEADKVDAQDETEEQDKTHPRRAKVGVFSRARKRKVRAAAFAALESVGMGEVASDRPDGISGGQAQRVSLARALAARPSVLLLDEPFSAVDAAAKPELLRLIAATGATVVMASHDPDALKKADRVMTLRNGQISEI